MNFLPQKLAYIKNNVYLCIEQFKTSKVMSYYIAIKNKKTGAYLYHKGGNILFRTPTMDVWKAKIYKTLRGAKQGLRSVEKRIGGPLMAEIVEFKLTTI